MNRRMFSTLLGAAPLAIGRGKTVGGDLVPRSTPPDAPVNLGAMARTIIEPMSMKDYWKAKEAWQKAQHYRYQLREARRAYERDGANPNIMCLRSISAQHKCHMMVQWSNEEAKRNETYLESLLDKFGVRDFFNRVNGESAEKYPATGAMQGSQF